MQPAARALLAVALLLAALGLPVGAPPKGADLGLAQGGPALVAKGGVAPAGFFLAGSLLAVRRRGRRLGRRGPAARPPWPPVRRRLYLLYARLSLEGG